MVVCGTSNNFIISATFKNIDDDDGIVWEQDDD